MKIKNLPYFKRPRERLVESGIDSLSDADLLALIIRSGSTRKSVNQIAHSLVQKASLADVGELSYESLLKRTGIGSVSAGSLIAAFEIARRVNGYKITQSLTNLQQAVQIFERIRNYKKEHFMGIYLNARKHIVHEEIISIGTLDASIVHPREVFEPAIKLHAAEIIVGHNHPSGDPQPSHADITLTKRLIKAGDLLGIPILDHIIVSESGYFSFSESLL